MRPLHCCLFGLGLGLVACGGDDTADAGINYELPQIEPFLSPVCLSYKPVRAGTSLVQPLGFKNLGRQPLVIQGAEFQDVSAPDIFTLQGITPVAPDSVASAEDALAQFRYAPTTPGWDYATLVVTSNAENYPRLRVFTLGLAYPGDLDAGSESTWDAGPKPDAAYFANGEACTDAFRP